LAFAAAPARAQGADQLEANKRVVRAWLEEVVVKGNQAKIAELATPDVLRHGALPPPQEGYGRAEGRAAVRDHYERHRQSRTVTQIKILDIAAEGDLVATRQENTWRVQTPSGPKTAQVPTLAFYRIKDGKLAEFHLLQDRAELNRQLNGG
jgi:predicted SnoaL-like aldol condensation-catalyzing enzyme